MNLNPAHRRWILLGGAIIFVLGYLDFFVLPSLKYFSTLQVDIPKKRQDIQEIRALAREYSTLKEKITSIKDSISQKQEKSIISILDSVGKEERLNKNITSMDPISLFSPDAEYEETGVQVKMEKVGLKELVNYLYKIESPPYLLKIKNLDIKPQRRDRTLLEVNFVASRVKRKD